MTAPNVADRITIEPGHHGGQPSIRGLPTTVRDVLASLARGTTVPELLDQSPELTTEDICACFAFAADLLSPSALPGEQPTSIQIAADQRASPVDDEGRIAIEAAPDASMGWMQPIIGLLADEPAFDEVLAYGRAYRDADRPAQDDGS